MGHGGAGELVEYLSWAGRAVVEKLRMFLAEPDAYNSFVAAHLPNREKRGKILRSDVWRELPSREHFLRDELQPDEVAEFARLAGKLETPGDILPGTTRDDYLRFCEICYEGAGCEGLAGLSPLDKYRKMADGRHDGLLDLPGKSAEALDTWLRSGSRGGHPWEIARGGNTTHISLYLHREEGGCRLGLAGSARTRAAETIRMALALHRAAIPCQVHDASALSRMAEGRDWIGVVPDDMDPRYATDLFPKGDEIHDVMTYSGIHEHPRVEACVVWYLVEPLRPAVRER